MWVIVYWEHISLSVSSTLSESVITMAQISAGSLLLSRLRHPWKRISGVGCQPIGPELFIPLKPIHTVFKYLAQPLPSHSCCTLETSPSFLASLTTPWLQAQTWAAVKVGLRPGRVGGMQVQPGWRVREEGSRPLLGWTAPSLLWSTLWWGSPLTITHPNLIMQISTSKSNTL